MSKVNYTNQSTVSEGTYNTASCTYNVSATVINNATQKNALQVLNVQVRNADNYLGDIRLENGRRIVNLVEGSDFVAHLVAFQDILNEILGKEEAVGEVATEEAEVE